MLSSTKPTKAQGQSSTSGSGPGNFDGNRDPVPTAPAPAAATLIEGVSNNYRNIDISGSMLSAARGTRHTAFQGRQGPSKLGRPIDVTLNAFPVTQLPAKNIFQYSVRVGSGAEKRGLVKKVWLSKAVQGAIGKGWIFDGGALAWSPVQKSEIRINVDLDAEAGQTPGRNIHRVVISPAKQIKHDSLVGYLNGNSAYDKSILESITTLDHIMRETVSNNMTSIKRSFYANEAKRTSLGGGVDHVVGMYQSIRIAHHPGGHRLVVNVDTANGTFWSTGPLSSTVLHVTGLRSEPEIGRALCTPGNKYVPSLRRLRRMGVFASHRKGQVDHYVIESFLQQDATQYMIRKSDGSKISVQAYMQKTHNLRLRHPDWPVIQMTKKAVVPLELLKIEDNQRFSYKLNEIQTAGMIKVAVTPPSVRWAAVMDGVKKLDWAGDEHLNSYGMQISATPITTKAKLLQNPKVQFAGAGSNGQIDPRTSGRWDLRGKKFFQPNTAPLRSWGVCVLPGRVQLDKTAVDRFMQAFVTAYTGHGGNIASKTPYIQMATTPDPGNAAEEAWKAIGNAFNARPQIMIFVLQSKDSNIYGRIKRICECKLGVVTQCVQWAHVQKAQGQYISNVLMKFNAKLGGFTNRAVGTTSPLTKPWGAVRPGTMIIGCDVSHAAPGIPGASMAAITVSTNKSATRYAAACAVNGSRVEMVMPENWESCLMPLVRNWFRTVGENRFPTTVMYFRDGVSEGQFSKVIDEEVASIKACFARANISPMPKFVVIIASKRHHVRFFPKQGDNAAADKNANPLPGTLVETGVTQPYENDFYLCSHTAIKGTARPVHYNVLVNEAAIPNEELQTLIYEHSYQYVRATTPVSLFPAVYYAHLASNRGGHHNRDFGAVGTVYPVSSNGTPKFPPLLPMANLQEMGASFWYI